jgi:HTH-type transcriptional regulator / antitoxin MqsA
MATKCVCCDAAAEMTRFTDETHTVTFRDLETQVEGLSGYRCGACGEIEFDPESAQRYAKAGDDLVLEARIAVGQELRRIRKKLRLSQIEASELTGGGHNAFSRYETGKVYPTAAIVNLFRILDRHPEVVEELKGA